MVKKKQMFVCFVCVFHLFWPKKFSCPPPLCPPQNVNAGATTVLEYLYSTSKFKTINEIENVFSYLLRSSDFNNMIMNWPISDESPHPHGRHFWQWDEMDSQIKMWWQTLGKGLLEYSFLDVWGGGAEFIFNSTIKGYYIPNQILVYFVSYLKIINTFLKNNICIL